MGIDILYKVLGKKISILSTCVLVQLISWIWNIPFIENKKILPYQYLNNNSFNSDNFLYAQSFGKTEADHGSEAYVNYINLKKLYIRWNTGVLDSRSRSRKYINNYLEKIVDREILTDFSYVLISPEGRYGKELQCNISLDKWLLINGIIPRELYSKIVEKNPEILTVWWRSTKLLSVQGKVLRFKIESSDKSGETVVLYLSDIKLKESGVSDANNTGKNSK
jgi:hypothetical protein